MIVPVPELPYSSNYYYGSLGNFSETEEPPVPRKDTIIQSFWTKPIQDEEKLKKFLYIAALSLTYAHNSGYKVIMYTDSKGKRLLKNFGYDKICTSLNAIPETVPTDLFAAGKFYAMKAAGITGKVHVDLDVFLKKPGVLDPFYRNSKVDAICQQDEDDRYISTSSLPFHMHILGYPVTTRPDWKGSMNTGIVGFHNREMAKKYMDNYFDALKIYTKEKFDAYKAERNCDLEFDFILEQHVLSFMSLKYNVYTLLPTVNATAVADVIGYQHLQSGRKWENDTQNAVQNLLKIKDERLYNVVQAL